MAGDYIFACFDCKEYLHLGKVCWLDSNRNPLGDVFFEGVIELHSATPRHRRDEYFARAIEAFLILHRNHELRVVPEGVDEMLEKTLGFFRASSAQVAIAEAKRSLVDWTSEKHLAGKARAKGKRGLDRRGDCVLAFAPGQAQSSVVAGAHPGSTWTRSVPPGG